MKIVADESIDRQIVDGLRQAGYSVDYVAEMDPGISDETVLSLANEESAVLLTADKDFGELVFRQHRVDSGVVLIRLAGLSPTNKALLVAGIFDRHSAELSHGFTVITPGAIRIRRRIA